MTIKLNPGIVNVYSMEIIKPAYFIAIRNFEIWYYTYCYISDQSRLLCMKP